MFDVVVIGGGFTGLSAAFDLAIKGVKVCVLESDGELGGLAGTFNIGHSKLEKFYHHWFSSDLDIVKLVDDLGLKDRVFFKNTNTSMFFAKKIWKISSPLDLLFFKPLPFLDRIKLGLLYIKARNVKDWRKLENISAKDWLISLAGKNVYSIVWEPLLRGKFGPLADNISAVWIWNKLKLRGSSRRKSGGESLGYIKGGFSVIIDKLKENILKFGGSIYTNFDVKRLILENNTVVGVMGPEAVKCKIVLSTVHLPTLCGFLPDGLFTDYKESLKKVKYIGNICLVLRLKKSLSSTYWLNINDSGFPFVGIIEHTNLDDNSDYGGGHLVYLSKYLSESEPMFSMDKNELVQFTLPYLFKMFPNFDESWILDSFLWKSKYSQPIVEKSYGSIMPSRITPIKGLFIETMAQIYPEDRGTNYAVRNGRKACGLVLQSLRNVGE